MFSLYLYRIISMVYLLVISLKAKIKSDDNKNDKLSEKFLNYNNKFVMKRIGNKKILPERVLILLPHCIQLDSCTVKITSEIGNCKICKKCDIGNIVEIKNKYNIHVKVATGGTLARKIIKTLRPKLVIAVACERDLISGIYESFPLAVYGVFNIRENGPCFNTKVITGNVEDVLNTILLQEDK